MSDLPTLLIDGSNFDDFEGFTRAFSSLLDGYVWSGGLDAFNDILRGGFGTPAGGWVLRWLHSERSRAVLGHSATAERLQDLLPRVHSSNRKAFGERLAAAQLGEGPTLFDEIVEILRAHGPGGREEGDGVHLELM